MIEAEKRIREALAAGPTPGRRYHARSQHHGDTDVVYDKKCWYEPDGSRHGETPNLVITIAPADRAADAAFIAAADPETIAALLAEIDRLRAAIDTQPSPPTHEDMEWAGKVHLAKAEKENDALRAEVEALHRTATDRAGIIDSVREWTRGVVNDNWTLRAEVEALRAAIERHRLNIWGDREVQHPEDVALYAALAAKETNDADR